MARHEEDFFFDSFDPYDVHLACISRISVVKFLLPSLFLQVQLEAVPKLVFVFHAIHFAGEQEGDRIGHDARLEEGGDLATVVNGGQEARLFHVDFRTEHGLAVKRERIQHKISH